MRLNQSGLSLCELLLNVNLRLQLTVEVKLLFLITYDKSTGWGKFPLNSMLNFTSGS